MFNQKVNYYTQENPDYLNYSIGAPKINSVDIHNCGTTLLKYTKKQNCNNLPLQTWCSKNIATESFAMRPIVNPADYFNNIKKYLQSVVLNDRQALTNSGLTTESYSILNDYGQEPLGSLLQAVNIEVTNKLSSLMAQSIDKIEMFKDFNPICEGFIIVDITLYTYRSTKNDNHYYHNVLFSALNTTRYNTVSFKAELYQDTSNMMSDWNKAISYVQESKDVPKNINNKNSNVYIYNLNLLNDTKCVTGQENDCHYKGYNLSSSFSQLINDNFLANPVENKWFEPNSLADSIYNKQGNYDITGNIRITDNGPKDFKKLVKDLEYVYNN